MKKSFLVIATALIIGFVSAVAVCIRALNAQTVSAFSSGSMRVVVDAGHGGIDGGVSGRTSGVKESDLNLQIAMELKNSLEDMGFEVVLTRKTEQGLYDTTAKGFKKRDMQKRKEIIQAADPALVLSIHQNYYPSQKTRGAQVFYSSASEENRRFATAVQGSLNALYEEEGARPRKATAAEYFMLSCHTCPSVIVECGFLSNAADEALLQTAAWQKKLSNGIAKATLAYFEEFSV